ncbi:MAG: peptidase [Frankiales bacterium]|nr:peptidase [Frankiales bacterium]
MTTVGILAFVVALLVSVMLHEAGHFLTARHYGMKATQFFVGFGPTIFSRTKGETEYGVKAIPAGGFVKIVGMTPLEEVEPGDEERAFYKQPAGRKTVVLAAGSTVHFLICLVLVFITTATYGTLKESAPTLSSINTCVVNDPTVPCATATAKDGAKPSPALQSGLKAGDVVTAVNGQQVTTSTGFTNAVKASPGKALALTVKRGTGVVTVTITPVPVLRPKATAPVGAIGVLVQPNYGAVHYGLVGTVKQTGATIGTIITGTVDTFTKKLGTITQVYSKNRDPAGFIGVVGASKVSGEIAAAKVPLSDRVASIVLLVAGLNLFIGVFNLLPLLPLDGGHIAVVFFESVRDRIRRARGYVGEIKRVDYNRLMPLTFAVVVLFASFTVFLLGADIVNPITIN